MLVHPEEIARTFVRGVISRTVEPERFQPRGHRVHPPEVAGVLRMYVGVEVEPAGLGAGRPTRPQANLGRVRLPAEPVRRSAQPGPDEQPQIAADLEPGDRPRPAPPFPRGIAVRVAPYPLVVALGIEADRPAAFGDVVAQVVVEPGSAGRGRVHQGIVPCPAHHAEPDRRGLGTADDHPVIPAPHLEPDLPRLAVGEHPMEVGLLLVPVPEHRSRWWASTTVTSATSAASVARTSTSLERKA